MTDREPLATFTYVMNLLPAPASQHKKKQITDEEMTKNVCDNHADMQKGYWEQVLQPHIIITFISE